MDSFQGHGRFVGILEHSRKKMSQILIFPLLLAKVTKNETYFERLPYLNLLVGSGQMRILLHINSLK